MELIEFPVPPVVKTVTFRGTPDAAFDRFTQGIGTWWPLSSHSLGGADKARATFFERLDVGGCLVEEWRSGEAHVWGAIVEILRPSRIVFTWRVGRAEETAQLIEVAFVPLEDRKTRVVLTHSGWERLGERALSARESYDKGWPQVMARYMDIGSL